MFHKDVSWWPPKIIFWAATTVMSCITSACLESPTGNMEDEYTHDAATDTQPFLDMDMLDRGKDVHDPDLCSTQSDAIFCENKPKVCATYKVNTVCGKRTITCTFKDCKSIKIMSGVPMVSKRFGTSVSIPNEHLMVGTPSTEQVDVYKYEAKTHWKKVHQFNAPSSIHKGFGSSIDSNGEHVVIAAPIGDSGAGYIYALNADEGWPLIHTAQSSTSGAQLGTSVAINASYTIFGAPGVKRLLPNDVDHYGAALVLEREEPHETWEKTHTEDWLVDKKSRESLHEYGAKITLSKDSSSSPIFVMSALNRHKYTVLKTFSHRIDQNTRIAQNTSWRLDPEHVEAKGIQKNLDFGTAITTSSLGLFVGVPYKRVHEKLRVDPQLREHVQLYKRNSHQWNRDGRIHAPDDALGFGTTLSTAGDLLAIGAPDSNNGQGTVHLYHFRPHTGWVPLDVLKGEATPNARFGTSIHVGQTHMAIGAPGASVIGEHGEEIKEAGAVYIFPLSKLTQPQ